jgi:hypothetical protein
VIAALADEHVIGPLVQALRQRGMGVATVEERNLCSADDSVLLELAMQEQRLMLTNDADFLAIAADLAKRQQPFAPVVFWPQQRRTIQHLLSRIIPLANQSDYTSLCSRVFYL